MYYILLLTLIVTAGIHCQDDPCDSTRGDATKLDRISGNLTMHLALDLNNDTQILHLIISDSPRLNYTRADFSHPALANLKCLELVRNNIVVFNADPFGGLDRLRKVVLTDNSITAIENALADLENVTHLLLSDNQLDSTASLKNLTNLQLLNLRSNNLTDEGLSFEANAKLLTLLLSENHISKITNHTFKGLKSLINLDLTNNNIRTIDGEAFHSIPNLKELRLAGNMLEGFHESLFANSTNLKYLDVSFNYMDPITDFPLSIPSLEELKLRYCNIETIPAGYFNRLSNLKYLNLHGNNLDTFETGVFSSLTNLRKINLNANFFESLNVARFGELYPLFAAGLDNKDIPVEDQYTVLLVENPWDCSTRDMIKLRIWCGNHQVDFDGVFRCRIAKTVVNRVVNVRKSAGNLLNRFIRPIK